MSDMTVVMATNATGSCKITMAIIGSSVLPNCFKYDTRPRPLKYFSQQNAWMTKELCKSWIETVFAPAVTAFKQLRGEPTKPVALIWDGSQS